MARPLLCVILSDDFPLRCGLSPLANQVENSAFTTGWPPRALIARATARETRECVYEWRADAARPLLDRF